MAIVQISKLQQRSGNLVDLPQLDEAELGFASDEKLLFIGKESPAENIEVLTSYSNISFSQIEGSIGNLDIDPLTIANGQVLAYTGTEWTNKGGDAGGLITLGDVSNVKITGGAIGYTLETDGTGNLSWTPKGVISSFVLNVSNANPAVVTTTEDNFFTNAVAVTFTNLPGNATSVGNVLNGQTLYANIISSNSFSLYTDSALTTTYDATSNTAFPYTTVTNTTNVTNILTVTSSAPFTIGNPVQFVGTTFGNIQANTVYYVKTKPSPTEMTVSATSGGANVVLTTAIGSMTVYESGGRIASPIGTGSGIGTPGGTTNTIQYNNAGTFAGDSDLTFNPTTNLLTVNGNVDVSNNITAARLISDIATGTEPITVTSTTRVANLNVTYANVSDFGNVTLQTTGTFFPIFVNGSATANRALAANANLTFNAATGNLTATILNATGNVSGGNLTSSGVVSATGNVSGGNITTTGVVSATGNVSGGNITTTGVVAATGNVSGGNITTSGTITVANITTGSSGTQGNITGNWILTSGSRLQATYADLAEYYAGDQYYEPGTVLEFGGSAEVTLASDGSNKVAGVVSTDPAYAMNAKCPGIATAIALQGRVPCKVRGNIKKGDMMISGGNGYARPCSAPQVGTVIGKSLVDFSGTEGVIEIAVGRL